MEKKYWIGQGVLTHKKKDYRYGEALPEGLDTATVKRMEAKGKVASKVPTAVSAPDPSAAAKKLTAELGVALLKNTELTGERDAALEQVKELTKTIESLTAAPPAPPAPKGGRK